MSKNFEKSRFWKLVVGVEIGCCTDCVGCISVVISRLIVFVKQNGVNIFGLDLLRIVIESSIFAEKFD